MTFYMPADVALSYRPPAVFQRAAAPESAELSILLSEGPGIADVMQQGASLIHMVATLLPVDADADARFEELMSRQPPKGGKRSLPRK